jgi:hypothetical protein
MTFEKPFDEYKESDNKRQNMENFICDKKVI